MGRRLEVSELGLVEYDDGLDLQKDLREKVYAGDIPDQLLLLEHPPVITLGRNSGDGNVVASPEELASRGVSVFEAGRGGDVTFHGPGQVVGYPILDLKPDRRDVRKYVRDLEEVIIRTLAEYGVSTGRIPGLTGVWMADLKVAAIGVRISRWVTSHGFALNVDNDLSYFNTIVPCGISDRGVTSLSRLAKRDIDRTELHGHLARHLAEVFEREPTRRDVTSRSIQSWVWREADGGEVEVLLLKRVPKDGGFWQPVTGMIEPGESPADAASRETLEETGVTGPLVDLEFLRAFRLAPRFTRSQDPYPWINEEAAFAIQTDGKSTVTLSPDEHDEYLWLNPSEARERLKWNGNKRALDRLLRHLGR